MQFPILSKDLRLSLRRLDSFISAFTFYSVMTVTVGFLWEINVHGSSSFETARDVAARQLFLGFIVLGFIGFCFHGGVSAARILVQEREKNTYALLQATPLSPWRLILEKLFTPLVFELLLFFGVFPALALVFIIGGISPQEYAYQLTNLLVWILTSLTLGLWNSSRSYTTTKAVRRTFLYLFFAFFIAPHTALIFFRLAEGLYLAGPAFFCHLLAGVLYGLSPVGMILSFYPEYTGLSAPTPSAYGFSSYTYGFSSFIRVSLGFAFQPLPVTVSWPLHVSLQLLLLASTARKWRKVTSESSGRNALHRDRTGPNLIGTAAPAYLPPGRLAFFAQEDRVVFSRGSRTKRRLIWAYCLFAFFLAFTGSGRLLSLLSLGVILFFSLALAPNSFRKEREQGTSVFLLGTPYYPRDYLLGKWCYLQAIGFAIILVGFLAAMFWTVVFQFMFTRDEYVDWSRGFYSRRFSIGRIYLYLAVLVPMLTLEGLMVGLRIRKKIHPIRFLIPIGVLAGGWLLILILQTLNRWMGNLILWRASSFIYNNPWPVGVLFPYALIAVCVYLLRKGFDAPPFETADRARGRALIAKILLGYMAVDFLTLLILPPDFSTFDLRNHLRLLIAAAAFNWFPWVWLVRRPESWWRERLLGPGAI